MNAVVTTKADLLNTSVLARFAERWRPIGLFPACLDRNGALLWQDPQMPRVLSLCLTVDSPIPQQIKRLGEAVTPEGVRLHTQLPWVQMQLLPMLKRRRVTGWIVMIGRTDAPINTHNEEAARFAQQAAMDGQMLATLSGKAPLVPGAMFGSLVRLAEQMHADLQGVAVASGELAGVTEQLTTVYEEISLLSRISSGMRFSQKPQAFLEMVCREVKEVGNFRTVMVTLASRTDETAGDLDEAAVQIGECPVPAHELLSALSEPLHDALSVGETQVHNDIAADCDWARLRGKINRFVCVPLKRDKRPLGVLVAVDKNDTTEFNSVDLKLLNNVGDQCSIFLENAALYRDMHDLFMGVLHALTRSIDAKDAYTRGHSQRVAELSRDLARKIGLPEEQCERVYLSGLLHDVGKIGVPEAVLTKPGRLTDEEFAAIKKHPAIGAQILGNIRQLQDIIPGVLYHHERWDGRGYPHMIAGEAIPLIGRIICVADSFDAMSSTRTYRPALPLASVLEEVKRCGGAQFDPELAKVFVTLDFSRYFQSIDEQKNASPTDNAVPLLQPRGVTA
jgi:HD-GYP domain-containing protein (c-di-GMP phosphodiesterase class II)